jgi:hypothetical protein
MKKIFGLMLLCAVMVGFVSCEKEDDAANPLKGTLWSYDDEVTVWGEKELLTHYIEFVDNKALLTFCDKIKADGHKIVKMQIGKCDGENDFPNALFSIRTKDRDHVAKLVVELRRLKYVKSVEEL